MENWNLFWNQLINKKSNYKMNNSSIFHYVTLEFLGRNPDSKISVDEKKYIRELPKNDLSYDNLEMIYKKRYVDYNTLS